MTEHAATYLAQLDELRHKYPKTTQTRVSVSKIISALNEFMEVVRYLNTRRTAGAVLELDDEAAVQDALFVMLRPWVPDLTPEDPNRRVANRFTIKDFVSRLERVAIEAKFIRDRDHGKHITKEIHDDIETYRQNEFCDDLIFFIYDPDTHIPDARALRDATIVGRNYDGRILTVHLIVKP